MTQRTLVKTDKNGTKYYHCTQTCGRCAGTGIVAQYIQVNGGQCFDCWGAGIVEWNEKEYTPEYEEKLQAQREKRAAKKLAEAKAHAAEKNAEFFERNGFNPEGKTYFVLGNTYEIKEELKAQGAKWDGYSSHWHMATKPEGREVLELSADDVYTTDEAGIYDWRFQKNEYLDKIHEAEDKLRAAESPSEYVGQVGDKIQLTLTYTHTAAWENSYGGYWSNNVTFLHTFKDENGNVFTWKTGNCIEADYGDKLVVKGTIKDHNEYKGIKQTVLTRCKIMEEVA